MRLRCGITSWVIASTSEVITSTSEVIAFTSEVIASTSEVIASTSKVIASTSKVIASTSKVIASTSEVVATINEVIATTSEVIATINEVVTLIYEVVALINEVIAIMKEVVAPIYEVIPVVPEVVPVIRQMTLQGHATLSVTHRQCGMQQHIDRAWEPAMTRHLLKITSILLVTAPTLAMADTTVTLAGVVVADGGPTYTLVPFEVPSGTAEIQVHHVLEEDGGSDILDFGLWDANGYRGWGGGNTEDIVVGQLAASRSYHPGAMPPGTWNVVIGKALVAVAAPYSITISLRDTPALPAETDRTPYTAVPALNPAAGWYAGDFHVHSEQSGDARPTITTVATVASQQGLDFVELSEHNVDSQVDLIPQVQAQFPHLLILPGDELTTYSGHANGIGATHYVDHRLGLNGRTASQAFDDLHAEGALVSINHPILNLGNLCLGCEWRNDDVTPDQLDAVEIENGGWNEVGSLFGGSPIAYWEGWLGTGQHVAALGGSDDHRAGIDEGEFGSVISHPTTMVYATELSVAGILDGVSHGRTVVKLESASDPMIDLTSGSYRVGDTILASTATLSAVITGGSGQTARWVHNGVAQDAVSVTSDPFTLTATATAPATGEDRWRAEVLVDGSPRTITSHIWIAPPAPTAPAPSTPGHDETHGCSSSGGGLLGLAMLASSGLLRRRRSAR